MKLRLDATPEELSRKSGKLIKVLHDILQPIAPGISEILEKALPKKEQILKYPVLRGIQEETESAYKKQIELMLNDINAVLYQSIAKSIDVEDDLWVKLDDELGENLWKALSHKYVKRVPYFKDGKRAYRYYYRESAIARETKEGESVRIGDKIIQIINIVDGKIVMKVDGEIKVVSSKSWTKMLVNSYGNDFYIAQAKRARQSINAILRIVPRDILKDIKGSTDAKRLADLKNRVPLIYDKLEKAFQRSGISVLRAKDIIAETLKRKKWMPEARAVALGSVLTFKGAKSVISYKDLLDGAENLAGGKIVEAGHAQAAVTLSKINIDQVATKADEEIARLKKLLAEARKAKKNDLKSAASVVVEALKSENVQKLNVLSKAFPGVKDKAVADAKAIMLEVPSVIPRKPQTDGSQTSVILSGAGGKAVALDAQYRLIDYKSLQPSHDPMNNFERNSAYPKDVQERAYHRDKLEQDKVRRNAKKLNSRFLVNTNPDAVNGPPIITKDGIVLGGNSRAMSMQLAYTDFPAQAAELKNYMITHAYEVGLQAQDVEAMENPVLVRVVDVSENSSTKELQLLVRQMNESFIQAMDPRTMQVAMARKLDAKSLSALTRNMADDETLISFLSSSRSKVFIDNLLRVGIIDERNANQYVSKAGILNQDGMSLIARLLVGKFVDDADLLSSIRPNRMIAVAGAVPYLVQAQEYGKAYNLNEPFKTALHALNRLQDKVDAGYMKALDAKTSDRELDIIIKNEFSDMFGEEHPILKDVKAQAILKLCIKKPGQRQLQKVFKQYAKFAASNPEKQASMFDKLSFDDIFKLSVAEASKEEEEEVKKGLDKTFYDHTAAIADKDSVKYQKVKEMLFNLDYSEDDFNEGGFLYGLSVNQLLEFLKG